MKAETIDHESMSCASGEPLADAAIARLAKALGHPARVRIVRLLLERAHCIGGDIVAEVGLAQSTVSEHLRILRATGLVIGEVEGPRVCYALAPASVAPLATLLATIAAHDVALDRDCCG